MTICLPLYSPARPSLLQEQSVLSAEVRLGGHTAQGPGRHQGAAAVFIVPMPASTMADHAWDGGDHQGVWSLETEGAGGWCTGGRGRTKEEEEDSTSTPGEDPPPNCCPLDKSALLPPPRDNSGPLFTAALWSQKPVQRRRLPTPPAPFLTLPPTLTSLLLYHWTSPPPPGEAEPARTCVIKHPRGPRTR